MLTKMIKLGLKMKEDMKATQSEIKGEKKVQGTDSEGKEARIKINDLEQKQEINIQLEQKEKTRIKKKKNKESLKNL